MFRIARSNLRARTSRTLLSAVAVSLGVAFVVGTLVLTATLQRSYDRITDEALAGVDAVVRTEEALTSADGSEVRGIVDARALDVVSAAPGVEAAEPHVEGIAQLVGPDGRLLDDRRTRATPIALGWSTHPELNPLELVAGTAPVEATDVVVDRRLADDADLALGDEVGVLTASGRSTARVVGIATYGGADDAGGAHVTAFRADRAAELFAPDGPQALHVVAADGVTEAALARSLGDALAVDGVEGTEVLTGAEARDEAGAEVGETARALSSLLFAFAVVSLVVGAFVIANAFSITVAQRTRESALLRALGASRGQVVRAVVVESLVTGLVASAAGAVLGIGAAGGLRALVAATGVDLPAGPLVVPASAIVLGIVVGTVVTLVSTYRPARRAARVPPVAALREVAVDRGVPSRARAVVGWLLAVGGVGAMAAGVAGGAAVVVGAGACVAFAGVVVLGPVLAPAVARVLGLPLRRLSRVSGALATENARRNPKRTSATSASLMVGLALVAFMTILATSVQVSFAGEVEEELRGDWIVSTVFGQGGVTPELAAELDALPETGAVSPFRYTVADQDGRAVDVSGVAAATVDQVIDADVVEGRLPDLATGGVAVREDEATAHDWTVGDVVPLAFPATGAQELPVVAVYAAREPLGPFALSLETFDAHVADATDRFVIVADAPGVASAEAAAAMDEVLAAYPTATLETGAEFAAGVTAEIGTTLNLVYVLLGLAVVIALFGLANTMALAVHERTRELGLLRAVGMGRRQVRAMVRGEAVLVSSIGTLLGLLVGAGFAFAVVDALGSEGIDQLVVPAVPLVAIVAFGAVAGVVASTLPARRASRIDVLQALHAD